MSDPQLQQVRANGLDDEPQYKFDVNWEKASALGLTITDINNTLSAAWGSHSSTTSSTGVASSAYSSRAGDAI
jgi:multidrug efflux pump subunit AcrB